MLETQHNHGQILSNHSIHQHTCSTSSKYCLTALFITLHCLLDDGSCFLKCDLTYFRSMLLFTAILFGNQKDLELKRNIGHLV